MLADRAADPARLGLDRRIPQHGGLAEHQRHRPCGEAAFVEVGGGRIVALLAEAGGEGVAAHELEFVGASHREMQLARARVETRNRLLTRRRRRAEIGPVLGILGARMAEEQRQAHGDRQKEARAPHWPGASCGFACSPRTSVRMSGVTQT